MVEVIDMSTEPAKDDKPARPSTPAPSGAGKQWNDLSRNTQRKYKSLGLTPERYNAGERPDRSNRADRKPAATPAAKAKAKTRTKNLKRELQEMIEAIGGLVALMNPYDGTVVAEVAPRLADNLMDMADRNPRLRAALESAVALADNAGIGVTVAALVVPILANHNVIPRELGMVAAPMLSVSPPPVTPQPGLGAMFAGMFSRPETEEHVPEGVEFSGEPAAPSEATAVVTDEEHRAEAEVEGRPAYAEDVPQAARDAIRGDWG